MKNERPAKSRTIVDGVIRKEGAAARRANRPVNPYVDRYERKQWDIGWMNEDQRIEDEEQAAADKEWQKESRD